jgi:DNA-binding LacI/PurR family transcriptional regulator
MGAVERLRTLGLQRMIALVGFDDLVLPAAVEPALTVIAQDAERLGRAAAELLFAGSRATAARRAASSFRRRSSSAGAGSCAHDPGRRRGAL